MGVFNSREQAKKLYVRKQSLYRRFDTEEEGWSFVKEQLLARSETVREPPISPPEGPTKEEPPPVPPFALSGRDKSTKKADEVFEMSLDCDTQALRTKLSPPQG